MNPDQLTTILFVGLMTTVTVWRVWDTFRKQGSMRGKTSMMWSFYALFAGSCVVFGGSALEFFFVPRPHSLTLMIVGIALFVVANAIRVVATRTLGRYWSLHIELREQQPLVREGIYGYVRHPAYASFVLEHVAVPLAGTAWWSLAVAVFVYVPLLVWRLRREETALTELLGEPYTTYQREVGALIPHWTAWRRPCGARDDRQ